MYVTMIEPDFTFQDERGYLAQLVHEGYSQINYISSVAGAYRGGHYHKENTELFYVISGEFEFEAWRDEDTEHEKHIFRTGDMFTIGPNIIHSFTYTKDSQLVSMYTNGVERENEQMDIYREGE